MPLTIGQVARATEVHIRTYDGPGRTKQTSGHGGSQASRDLLENFCRHVRSFHSDEDGEASTESRPASFLLTEDEALALARYRNEAHFGALLGGLCEVSR